jgi:hypothetical protein
MEEGSRAIPVPLITRMRENALFHYYTPDFGKII